MTHDTVTVQVRHTYRHPPAAVFDAWLDPRIAGGFLFATPTGTIVQVEIDAREGGGFLFVDRRDGVDVAHVGEYLEIDRPRRLVFAFKVPAFSDQSSTVALDFAPRGDGCEVTLTHQGVLPDYAERTQDGWTGILGKLSTVLA